MIAILGVGAMVAGGCRHHAASTVAEGSRVAVTALPAGSFARQWSASLNLVNGAAIKNVWLRNGLLFVRSDRNNFYQFSADTGSLDEVIKPYPSGAVTGIPVVTKSYIVVPGVNDLAIYDHHGREVKVQPLGSAVSSGGAVDGERLFIGTIYTPLSAGRLLAMDLSSGYINTVWQLQRPAEIGSTPVVYGHVVYAADKTGDVFAVTTDDNRDPIWPGDHVFHTYAPIMADLKADEDGLYVASSDSVLYCLDRNTAQIKWQWFSGLSLTQAPILTKDTIYQPLPGNGLAALDRVSKNPDAFIRKARWVASARQFLARDDSHVYVLDDAGRLAALDNTTGKILFQSERSDFVACATNPGSDIIYAAVKSGQVIAIRPILKAGLMGIRQ